MLVGSLFMVAVLQWRVREWSEYAGVRVCSPSDPDIDPGLRRVEHKYRVGYVACGSREEHGMASADTKTKPRK
jgi:hypothetical protein